MSDHGHILRLPAPERAVPARFVLSTVLLIAALVGGALSILGAFLEPRQFAFSWFFAFYTFFTIANGGLFWLLLHYVCNGSWDLLLRRIWENMATMFPWIFGIFVPLVIFPQFRDQLWQWFPFVGTGNKELNAHGHGYLTPTFFYVRVIAYFVFFIAVSAYYRRNSLKQDADGSPVWAFRCHYHSYFLMTLWALVETFASFDWLMGLDWKWSSSLFGAYHFAVCAQAGLAFCIVVAAWLKSHGFLVRLNREHYHLAGKLLFGFTILWAYFAFGQFLLVWYANIPEETILYNDHNRGLWKYLTYFIIVGKFMFPVIYLLAQDTKRHLSRLTFIAVWILGMHVVEMWWFIMPYAHTASLDAKGIPSLLPSWLDFVTLITVGSFLGYVFIRKTCSAPLFPTRDPRMPECLTVTN